MHKIAVLATLDSKLEVAEVLCQALSRLGAEPLLMDLSFKPQNTAKAKNSSTYIGFENVVKWPGMRNLDRKMASELIIDTGSEVLLDAFNAREISGVAGVGGANGCAVFCDIMRKLPPLFPKIMITPAAATAGVQWYVAESDIVMFPTISDITLNYVTRTIIENAAIAINGMAQAWQTRTNVEPDSQRLIGVSTFGNLQKCIDEVTLQLEEQGFEVIHFHASGAGGKALENFARRGKLFGVIDITTSELCDSLNNGVFRSGDDRLTQAGKAGIPQVVVPGALDHTNWWVGQCPLQFHDREFYTYNKEIFLMRTNAEEMKKLGKIISERLNAAKGPVTVMIPNKGFSAHVIQKTFDINGAEIGNWFDPETDRHFTSSILAHLKHGKVKEFDLHINDREFASACVDEFQELLKQI